MYIFHTKFIHGITSEVKTLTLYTIEAKFLLYLVIINLILYIEKSYPYLISVSKIDTNRSIFVGLRYIYTLSSSNSLCWIIGDKGKGASFDY